MKTQEQISNSELIENLNDIVVKNYDASKGYRKAAEKVEHQSLEKVFQENAQQRMQFAGKLQSEIRLLGGEPKSDSSILGDAHRAWIDVKNAFASNATEAVVEECCTGEQAAVEEYDELLNNQVPQNIQEIVLEQRNHVNQSLQYLKHMNS